MKPTNNESKIVFWKMFGRFGEHFLTHVGDFWALDVKKTANGWKCENEHRAWARSSLLRIHGGRKLEKKDPKPKIGHMFFEGRFWITAWSHFCSKIDAKNEVKKRWVQNRVLDDFWSIWGTFLDSFWRLLGPRRQTNGERVKMWKWAPRLSEKLTFEDSWGSKIDKKGPEAENWTHVFRGTILDHSLGAF